MNVLDKLISRSYGSVDLTFAGNSFEITAAQELIQYVFKENMGFQEYLDLNINFLKSKNVSEEHLEEQLAKIKDITTYFQYD